MTRTGDWSWIAAGASPRPTMFPRASRRGGFCVVGMFVVAGALTRLFRYAQNPPSPTGEGLLTLLLLSIDGKEIFAVCLKFYQTFRSFLKVWSTVVPPRWGRVAGECPTGEVVPRQKQVCAPICNKSWMADEQCSSLQICARIYNKSRILPHHQLRWSPAPRKGRTRECEHSK